jgi:hypothetical protein
VISLTMPMEDLVREHPGVVPALVRRRVVCIQCGEPVWGTLEEALSRAGIRDPADQLAVLKELAEIPDQGAGE